MEPKLILHGGIESTDVDAKTKKEEALEQICTVAYDYLKDNTAIDSVEFAIKMLEDNPLFNAGTGAILQSDGVQRMDACIMDGYSQRSGAVSQIRDVKNPINVARLVMEKTPHNLIIGEEAQKFAYLNGVERHCTLTRESVEKWFNIKDGVQYGTVGAVAIDEYGHIAAATSTGGWATSLPGRVGDVPIIGHGTYADKHVGISCTGNGEKISNRLLSARIIIYVEEGYSLKKAAEKSLQKLEEMGGVGGFIAIISNGDLLSTATQGAYMPVSSMPKS